MSTESDKKHGLSEDELKLIAAKKKEYMDAAAAGNPEMADLAREYHDTALDILLGDHGTLLPGPGPGCGPDPDPNDEHVKEGGWGGNEASPEQWEVVPMKDDPKLFKVVDAEDTNIAHKFETKEEAEEYVKWHQCRKEQGLPAPVPPGPPAPPPSVPPGPPPAPGAEGDGPYPVKGEKLGHTIRGPTTRHYASGKPDDETIEANVKNIKFANHQFVVDVGVPNAAGWAHDDNLSMKHGGTHMGTGWFDEGIGVYTGQSCLGKEEDHPSTDLCVIKGPKIGDIRDKRIKLGAVYYKAENKVELWTNLGDGWKKQIEGTNVGGFNPKASEFECQLRIDGFKKSSVPKIHDAWVSEI